METKENRVRLLLDKIQAQVPPMYLMIINPFLTNWDLTDEKIDDYLDKAKVIIKFIETGDTE